MALSSVRHDSSKVGRWAVARRFSQRRVAVEVGITRVTDLRGRGEYSAWACVRGGRPKKCAPLAVYGRSPTAAFKRALASLSRSIR